MQIKRKGRKMDKEMEEKIREDRQLPYRGLVRHISTVFTQGQTYIVYPISEMPSHQLSWSHYVELLKIDDDLERSFYEQQTQIENWSVIGMN